MKRNTKSALVLSIVSIIVCCTMLLGTTMAWFTDSVTSATNIIKAGNLDVEMYWLDGTSDPTDDTITWTDASTGAIFNYDLWEPGYTEVRHIKIANVGSLALKYQITIIANGTVSELAEVIDVYYVDPAVQVEVRSDLSDDYKIGTLKEVLAGMATTASGSLLAGENDTITLALKMQESAGNEYMNKSIGTDFSVQLIATQLTSETDSFDDQYDADVDYVMYYNTPGTYTLNASLMATTATDVITVEGAGVILNITGGYYDVGSQDCAVWARNGGVVNIYGGTFIGDGVGTATSELHQDLIYASGGSKINIYGGTFSSRTDDWLLNEQDNKGEIVVYGGTFVNWNPADNVSEGPDTSFLAEGYSVIVETKGEDTYYTVVKGTVVTTAAELNDAITDGDDVVLSGDLTFSASETTSNSGYGATGVTVDNGAVLDGNGNTLTVNGANGTWDSAVNPKSGTVKNLTVNGAFRGIFMGSATGDVYIDNVIIDKVCYTFNSDGGSKDYGVYISNSTLNGWTSFSDVHKEVVFTNCTFGMGTGSYKYAFCRPYNSPTVFENCVFEVGYEFDTSKTSDITFENCYYGDTLITAENAATLGDGETTFFYNGLNEITIK